MENDITNVLNIILGIPISFNPILSNAFNQVWDKYNCSFILLCVATVIMAMVIIVIVDNNNRFKF